MPPRAATPTTTSDVVTASFGLETDDIDEGGHGQDRPATAEGTEREPDEQTQGQGQEEVHTTMPGRAPAVSTGSPAAAQARMPPLRFTASKPDRTRRAVARAERFPERQTTTTRRSRGNASSLPSRWPRGTWRAPGAWPAYHSAGSRTSRSTAPERTSLSASFGPTPWSPPTLPLQPAHGHLPASVRPSGYPVGYSRWNIPPGVLVGNSTRPAECGRS